MFTRVYLSFLEHSRVYLSIFERSVGSERAENCNFDRFRVSERAQSSILGHVERSGAPKCLRGGVDRAFPAYCRTKQRVSRARNPAEHIATHRNTAEHSGMYRELRSRQLAFLSMCLWID